MQRTPITILFVLASASASAERAPEAPPAPSRATPRALHLDLEVDPTAYAFSGFSVHAGVGWRALRLDLGAYGMDIPGFFHGNEGWDASFVGAGAKLQWFPFSDQRGFYVDVSAGVSRERVELRATGATATETVSALGADAGYRVSLPHGFYATPWAGFSVNLNADDVMLDGQRYTKKAIVPFAAVHLGYRFR
jgi:hypothetical protein